MHNAHQHEQHGASKGTFTAYILGFSLSILLTFTAFALVYAHIASEHAFIAHTTLYIALVLSALIQLFVQLFFFLHVGKESKTHWNLTALAFALIVVSILVGGTLWIMWNLQHINPPQMQEPFLNGVVTPQTEG